MANKMLSMKVNILYSLITLVLIVGCSSANQPIHSESIFEKHQRCGFQKSGNKAVEDKGEVIVIHDPKLIDSDCK